MEKRVLFTICARNYLAQALALRESLKLTNPGLNLHIYVSDTSDGVENEDLCFLSDSWIPGWRKMAFKYNVIEFSTSIKPFIINHLFKSYDKVVFLDPDTYVTHSLDAIFESLENKDVMITPHYCEIQDHFTGAVPEEEILFVGIYNLGFLAIKNSVTGRKIVSWWMNRLADKCYADKIDALHVDQKWFDFIPAFFPDRVLISHHFGINTAIWNLHERELFEENGKYYVLNKESKEVFPLLFFHFSGFNPRNPSLINRRHPNYNITNFPSFTALFNTYTEEVLAKDFERYTQMSYGFNTFSNQEKITPMHRRIFREIGEKIDCENPFQKDQPIYKILEENKFLTGVKITDSTDSNPNIIRTRDNEIKKGIMFLKFLKSILGIKYYNYLLVFFSEYHRLERQVALIDEKKLEKYYK